MSLTTSSSAPNDFDPLLYLTPKRPVQISTVFTPPPECSTRPFTNVTPRPFDEDDPMWDTYIVTAATLSCWAPEWVSICLSKARELSLMAIGLPQIIGPCPHGYTTIGTRDDKGPQEPDSMLWYTTAYCCPPGFKCGTWGPYSDFMCSTTLDGNIEYTMVEYQISLTETSTATVNRKSTMALDRDYLAVWNSALLPHFTPPSAPVLNKEAVPSRPSIQPRNSDWPLFHRGSGGDSSASLPPRIIGAIVSSVVGTIIIILATWCGVATRRKKKREAKQMSG